MLEETHIQPDAVQEWARKALLFDFYSPLLTEKQCSIWDCHYQMDLSLAEIARQQNTSRQAVHALLRRTQDSLEEYEVKMGLIERFLSGRDYLMQADKKLQSLPAHTEGRDPQEGHLAQELAEIRALIQQAIDTY
jgi:predicted DNA-binding protein YlxM (UPF0122 family)